MPLDWAPPGIAGIVTPMKKPSVWTVFFVVFIDLIGFGVVLPLLPIYTERFGANGWWLGLITAGYSLMQFIFSPVWGKLSDRVGRRPILIMSTAGVGASYFLFAWGSSLEGKTALSVILASRLLGGFFAANISVAQAYIADITSPAERTRKLGLIGMAFGCGFILGPAIGALSAGGGLWMPGIVAGSICVANIFFAFFKLPESLPAEKRGTVRREGRFAHFRDVMGRKGVGFLIGLTFITTVCFACFEVALGLLIKDNLDLDEDQTRQYAGWLFAYCGLIGAFVQGRGIGFLLDKLGHKKLIILSLLTYAVSLFILPFARDLVTILIGLAILGFGSTAFRPPVTGMISMLTPVNEQGATLGVSQSMASLARSFSPFMVAPMYFNISPAAPFVLCGVLSILAGVVAAWKLAAPEHERESNPEA